jgi:hypothetical protein
MLRRVALLGGVLLALTASSAAARSDNGPGLYAPFPTPAAESAAQAYYAAFHLKLSKKQLNRGAFHHRHGRGLTPTTTTAASRRAGVNAGSLGLWPLVAIGLLAVGLAGIATHRRPLSAHP